MSGATLPAVAALTLFGLTACAPRRPPEETPALPDPSVWAEPAAWDLSGPMFPAAIDFVAGAHPMVISIRGVPAARFDGERIVLLDVDSGTRSGSR